MKEVFADAGYWIAVLHPSEKLHSLALKISNSLTPTKIITSEIVLSEVLDFFAAFGALFRLKAVAFVEQLRTDSRIEIVGQTPALFETSLKLYAQRPDKEWGLTDCSSFIIMKERGITDALAHDQHFVQAGFTALLRDE